MQSSLSDFTACLAQEVHQPFTPPPDWPPQLSTTDFSEQFSYFQQQWCSSAYIQRSLAREAPSCRRMNKALMAL